MKQILFATGNESKSKRFSKQLLENNIEVKCLKDFNLKLEKEEKGTTVTQNALIKAREAHSITKMPVIGMDDSLYLENVPDDVQPGLFVRRVNGKTLNDEEMIEYYTNIVKKYGSDGKLNCKWIYGLAVINERGQEFTYTWNKDNFYMVELPSVIINKGYPLNSISKYKTINKYFTDITEDDYKDINVNEDDVVEFIIDHI